MVLWGSVFFCKALPHAHLGWSQSPICGDLWSTAGGWDRVVFHSLAHSVSCTQCSFAGTSSRQGPRKFHFLCERGSESGDLLNGLSGKYLHVCGGKGSSKARRDQPGGARETILVVQEPGGAMLVRLGLYLMGKDKDNLHSCHLASQTPE